MSPARTRRSTAARAFTLIEMLMAVGLSGLVLTGVLTASLQLMRSSVQVTSYAEMDTQVRRTMEQLDVDLKAASNFTYNNASDITVTVANSDGTSAQYTYAWDSSTQAVFRVPGSSSASQTGRRQLLTGVSDMAFSRLDSSGNTAATDNATKCVQMALTIRRAASGTAAATSTVATIITLRNKPVS